MSTGLLRKALLVIIAVILSSAAPPVAHGQSTMMTRSDFRSAMRKLWEDHVVWTRLYIISVAGNLPDKDATAQRLLQNQTDIGNAVKPFYGGEAGDKLTGLLRSHILLAVDILAAAKANDTPKFNDAKTRWEANADEIAAFLNTANPRYWPAAEMRTMMRQHLSLTLDEASARLKGDWAADIAAFDKVHEQILRMADMLSDGIMRQFPNRFQAVSEIAEQDLEVVHPEVGAAQ